MPKDWPTVAEIAGLNLTTPSTQSEVRQMRACMEWAIATLPKLRALVERHRHCAHMTDCGGMLCTVVDDLAALLPPED